jgi:hypothetical protein
MRLSRRSHFAFVISIAAIVCGATGGSGLLPKPAKMPSTFGGVPPAHPFRPDPSGGCSRTIFATDEDADFKAVIRDFSFPLDGRPHSIAFPSAAVVHRLSGFGAVSVSNQQLLVTPRARIAVPTGAPIKPTGAPIKVTNSGDEPVVIRALIVEAK